MRISTRRGFTLAELLVYTMLVSIGLATFLSLEMGARQSLALQGAILDVEEEARRYLDAWRRDVESASQIKVEKGKVTLVRFDGHGVTYSLNKREERDAKGKVLGTESYPRSTSIAFERKGTTIHADLKVERKIGVTKDLKIKRTFLRTAIPRSPKALEKSK